MRRLRYHKLLFRRLGAPKRLPPRAQAARTGTKRITKDKQPADAGPLSVIVVLLAGVMEVLASVGTVQLITKKHWRPMPPGAGSTTTGLPQTRRAHRHCAEPALWSTFWFQRARSPEAEVPSLSKKMRRRVP